MGASTSCGDLRKPCSTCAIEAAPPPQKMQHTKTDQTPVLLSVVRSSSQLDVDQPSRIDEQTEQEVINRSPVTTAAEALTMPQGEPPPSPHPISPPCCATGVSAGYLQAMRGGDEDENNNVEAFVDEPEPAPEDMPGDNKELEAIDTKRETLRASAALLFVVFVWTVVLVTLAIMQASWKEPDCPTDWSDSPSGPPRACESCAEDLVFLPWFSEWERSWPKPLRAVLYFIGLIWTFLGIGIVCDQFMESIDEITRSQRVVWMEVRDGAKHRFHVDVWNPTVANLTLMALGSSAPEILLAVIEVRAGSYFAGELGPSTIVGSAAFNLLVITAVCITAMPDGEVRRIRQTHVFAVTACFSVWAYVWMLIVLTQHTPDKVDIGEAVVTFLMFPLLVGFAYMADRGYFNPRLHTDDNFIAMRSQRSEDQIATETARIQARFGKQLPRDVVLRLLKQNDEPEKNSKVATRKAVIRKVSGGSAYSSAAGGNKQVLIGFEGASCRVLECAGRILLKVTASRPPTTAISVRYSTQDGTAKAGVRYQRTAGVLSFAANEVEQIIEVPIIDDEVWQPDEYFRCMLTDVQVVPPGVKQQEAQLGISTTTITVINDDMPGTLSFDVEEVLAVEGRPLTIGVARTDGKCGKISCRYTTVQRTATAGRDYQPVEGVLEFEDGETHKTITVPIGHHAKRHSECDETFLVQLSNPSEGVRFDRHAGGFAANATCEVIIPGNKRVARYYGWFLSTFLNYDRYLSHRDQWFERFRAAFYCNGSPEDQSVATGKDWFFHFASLTFKVCFSVVPPTSIAGGWLCFVSALGMIGLVTTLVADLASLLGCCLGISDDITAITLVALGTSLPDTFASRMAAQEDETADNSIGNITGSNSVNVFLGLGLPWTLAALHWQMTGVNSEWKDRRWDGRRYEELYLPMYPEGGFIVPAGSLSASVAVFSTCAALCIGLLALRRRFCGGELGGPKLTQVRDGGLLIFLWFVYLGASIAFSVS